MQSKPFFDINSSQSKVPDSQNFLFILYFWIQKSKCDVSRRATWIYVRKGLNGPKKENLESHFYQSL